MNLSTVKASAFGENDRLLNTPSTFPTMTTLPTKTVRQSTNLFQRTSSSSRDRSSSFSGPQWLEMIETNRMFNVGAYDMLALHRRRSTCPEEKVAAVIYGYANGIIHLLSIGINGSPVDRLDPPLHIHKRTCVHGEDSALRQLPAVSSLFHLVCYTWLAPCLGCAEKLYYKGIEAVAYIVEYRDKAGKEFLLNKGMPVFKLRATGRIMPLNPDLCLLLFQPYGKTARREVFA